MKLAMFRQYPFFILMIVSLSCRGQDSKRESDNVRKPAVAGSFYPSDPSQLKSQIESYFQALANKPVRSDVAAVIVPHAGYVFSGEVAASAFAQIDPEREYERIFLIGTSHLMYMNGASIYKTGDFSTPLGIVKVDTELAGKLIKENSVFEDIPEAHGQEHSLEVQLPFLQCRFKKPFKIVPIIIGTQSIATCHKIANALKPWFNDKNLFVISSDFSHYPTYAGANDPTKQ
jgi:AmmeMemoRadiSam system protein B